MARTLAPPKNPAAARVRQLRIALGFKTETAMANRLGISLARWSGFEVGNPISREIAIKLVREFPGLTLDWIYLGKRDGLTLQMLELLRDKE